MKKLTEGECFLCNETFKKRGMSRHLKSCQKENFEPERRGDTIHLRIYGQRRPDYWMHLALRPETSLEELDAFLRDVWLECCGHLSMFEAGDQRYSMQPMEEYDELGMDYAIGKVVRRGEEYKYEYDFGSTTELSLEVESLWEGQPEEEILLLARNKPPSIECSCGKEATKVCGIHVHSKEGWLCEDCASKHVCNEDMLLPVVNSPRTGICGYVGSDIAFERSLSGGLKLVSEKPEKGWYFSD